MPNLYGCDIEVPSPVCSPCDDAELGGVRGTAFIHVSAYDQLIANPSNAAIWDMFRAQGLIYIIPQTRGTFNGGEVITRPGFGNRATVNVGFDFSLEYDDPAYKENCEFYNMLMQSGQYHVAFITETQVKISGKPVDMVPTAPITDDITEQAVWHPIVTWQDKLQPCAFDAPSDIFVCIDTALLPVTMILNLKGYGAVSNDTSLTFTGQLVDVVSNWFTANVLNAKLNEDATGYDIISNEGGDVAFMISQPYDAVPATLPRAAEMRIFGTLHYYGSNVLAESPQVQSRGDCGIQGDGLAVPDQSTTCNCPDSVPGFHDTLEKRLNVPLILPGKIYYMAVYAKGAKMQGSFSPDILKFTFAPANTPQDPEIVCSGLVWSGQWASEAAAWPNP